VKTNLTDEELKLLSTRNNIKAAWMFICNYAIVIATFVMVFVWTNPITIILAIFLLGARQLGFGVLLHECGHGTLFESKKHNQVIGDWFAAAAIFSNMNAYSQGHRQHHRLAGTENDPDLPNYKDYPISASRLRRKLARDITGKTGWRQVRGIARSIAKFHELRTDQQEALTRGMIFNISLLVLTATFGAPWLFILWVIAFIVVNPLISRIRQIGEHAAVPDLYDLDPRLNTRSIVANWVERLFICPMGVNYHLEHHLLASIPVYNLPKMHNLLKNNNFYSDTHITHGYRELYRQVTTR
jgi:fatty acid desaturase